MQSMNNIYLHTHTHPRQILNRRSLADLHSSCDNNWCHLLCRNFHKRLPKAKLNEIELISFFKVLWMRPVHVTPFLAAGVWYVTVPLSAGTWRWEIWDSRKVVVTTSPRLPKTERIRWVTSVCAHLLSENRWKVLALTSACTSCSAQMGGNVASYSLERLWFVSVVLTPSAVSCNFFFLHGLIPSFA